MSFTAHPLWPQVAPYIRVEVYDRDGGHAHPRFRLEVDPPDDVTGLLWLGTQMPCVACGAPMFPLRRRDGTTGYRHLYFAAACDQDASKSCSRGGAARLEYVRVRWALQHLPPPTNPQPSFWDQL